MINLKQIDLSLVLYLHTLKLNLNHLLFLQYYKENTQEFLPSKHKIKTELTNLGYIWEDNITNKGLGLVEECNNWSGIYQPKSNKKDPKKEVVYDERFMEWWNTYPTSDIFEYGGKLFTGTRKLHCNKDKCQVKYLNILQENKLSHQQLVELLKIEINKRMEDSTKKNNNELSYMSGSEVYLNKRNWERWIPLLGRKKVENINSEIVI